MRLSRPAPARVASGLGESIAGPLTSLTVIPSIPAAINASFTSSILKGLTIASIFFINSKVRQFEGRRKAKRSFVHLPIGRAEIDPLSCRSGDRKGVARSYRPRFSEEALVYRLAYNGDVVAFKMGRRQGGPSRTRTRGRIPHHFTSDLVLSRRSKNSAGRNRRATRPPAHFQRNPPGRGRLAVFLRCSLDPYESRYGRFTASPARTALKNSQLTCGDITIICETVH